MKNMKKNRLKLFPLIALLFSVVSCDLVPSDFLSSLNQLISLTSAISAHQCLNTVETSINLPLLSLVITQVINRSMQV